MSAARDELERTQARLRELEEHPLSEEQLSLLATALEREAETYAGLLERAERRALAREVTGQATRLMTFGFALVFATPIVAMIGVSASKALRQQPEAAGVSLVVGLLLILGVLLAPARRWVAQLVSPEWRFIARTRKVAASLRALISCLPLPRSREGGGEG